MRSIADGTGYMLKHPFVNHHLQKVLLDGHIGSAPVAAFVFPASHWRTMVTWCCMMARSSVVRTGFRRTGAIALNPSRRGLIVRYPIRMKEDLLPFENLSPDEVVGLLAADLSKRGCQHVGPIGAPRWSDEQLQLRGTLILHSEAAARNGGDFDFDHGVRGRGQRFHASSETGSPTRNSTRPS